ncbi:NADH-Ubiquinone/plastoquinone (complex I), various chains family protein [Sphingomonas sp. S17]|uniref:Monovalent cation/H+ antiporter subunit A n=2 Tax=Sphingomonas paucimobilis TaxID=13689 RepID=A0A411LLG8_SPHPI|nr:MULTISPECIES: monovalent cation/H+ antiporter subunit A [Sphingomonas]EGI55501.1 NADH-Ubiquinone/plastoquinone (complex I), various chains family protein [Sphingomonas sp. S17]MBQ1480698.1 monovalent cation/H+ antiporter subunit A [Sphingomonas sp.]MCM3680276.1 monovalent cation/H+ antiporter subunit A [Sphingomonas paucimobilis]MDG5970415.1 monovalent cation/H+ antiporter subunit A [Sphingomonas paucimobilis]NNG58678.1 monovalent cation/H+ antiporter subunit A [Sphingomonas paucimobilis]
MRVLLLALIFLPFIAVVLIMTMRRASRGVHMLIAAGASAGGLAILLSQASTVLSGRTATIRIAWLPTLGLDFSLWLDPLALLFAGLILGIGLLVVIYAQGYLAKSEPTARFLSFLMLFQGAMVGIALSSNILLMLVFWEMTSLASFLLIGFWRDQAEARQGARMALTITGGGGLALIAGMVLLGKAAGSYDLATILARAELVQLSPLYPAILLLILAGAFTKSAQFPFHFWLPHAMAAPTPVSAYLHSATMVKAGVFLLARLWPVLAGTNLWFGIVAPVGLLTMLFGAGVALFRHDLKAILAYSTISQLGLMVMLLGFGTGAAATAAIFHILNHAAFKAALFMHAGIVDHETGTRDIRRLGGLAAIMPLTATLGVLAAAAMAGLPPLGGFISKEMMLEQSAHTSFAAQALLVPVLATIAAMLSAAYSLRYAVALHFGKRRTGEVAAPHDPGAILLGPPAILAAIALALGLWPMTLAGSLVAAASAAVTGGATPDLHLSLWHGINPALMMSLGAVAVALLLLWRHATAERMVARLPLPDAKALFDRSMTAIVHGLRTASEWLHVASLQRYLVMLFVVALALGLDAALRFGIIAGSAATTPASPVAVIAWAALIVATLAVLAVDRHRYLALIFISVIGLVMALAFIHLSAPDLALTQIAVEVVTILLMLLALHLLPGQPPRLSTVPRRVRDAAIAALGGLGTGWLAWAIMTRPVREGISRFHWENSYSGGGGTNVVNVILVDFRAFDTLGEITVLGIAGLAIYALLEPAATGVAGQRLRAWRSQDRFSPERHPMMFVMATRLLLPLALLVGMYIFLRGHNQPGGGFIAALVFSIAILLQYLASGFDWTDARRKFGEHQLIGFGVLIAVATGLGALLFGAPFLTSSYGHVHLPLIGEFELATAMLFDLGVACVVVGAVLMALAQLAHIAQRAAKYEGEGRA